MRLHPPAARKNARYAAAARLPFIGKHIPRIMPPVFLWHTADDKSVDVQNSLLFASALAQNGARFDLHVFETGHHGLADCSLRTCDKAHPYPAHWLMLAQEWLGQRWA